MGMAASQARYLSLSARKSNVEYEGQQINQQRLVLSNQSADLFNQMLTMSVPTPPNANDFTKLQYSWKDGDISSVIDNYYQIGTVDDEFNYVVSSYHYENIYVGQRKFLVDPQVQAKKENHFSNKKEQTYTVQTVSYDKDRDEYTLKLINGFGNEFETIYKLADAATNKDTVEELDFLYDRTTPVQYSSAFEYDETNDEITYNNNTYSRVTITDDAAGKTELEKLRKTFGAFFDMSKTYYYNGTNNQYICKENLDEAKTSTTVPVIIRNQDVKKYYTDGTRYVSEDAIQNLSVGSTFTTLKADNNPTWYDYSAIGNSELKYISEEDYLSDTTVDLAIKQILKDMKSSDDTMSAYENIKACFDDDGAYIGGLYTFKIAGNTYYTTMTDLDESLKSAYSKQSVATNSIDSQQSKLSYYSAFYEKTKVSEIKKALLETDGAGRFTTAKFEDDSVVYTLNVETIKDEDAYNDAMNQYYYKQEMYDKQVAQINAKTEIIQLQDRQLQLKLEQLNTEQSALQTEMEACQKIVSKHVESEFKTFTS